MVKIGLLDSGIDVSHPALRNANIYDGFKNGFETFIDTLGHGTACAFLINQIEPEVSIYNVKIFDRNLECSPSIIVKAIEWCIQNDIKIINLSASVSNLNYFYKISEVCEQAHSRGIIIVSSSGNFDTLVLPAYLDNVIGVGFAKNIKEDEFYYLKTKQIKFYAKGDNVRVPSLKGEFTNVFGVSYSTANMTGIIVKNIIKSLRANEDFDIKKLIKQSKQPLFKDIEVKNKIFPFKSNTQPIKLRSNAEIIDKLGKIGLVSEININTIFQNSEFLNKYNIDFICASEINNTTIKQLASYETIIASSKIDTILENVTPNNFFVYDKFGECNDKDFRKLRPSLNIYEPYKWIFGELLHQKKKCTQHIFKSIIPIVQIINISKNQYCFDIEILIRDLLKKEGFNTSHIGSEIFSEFFGANFSLPPLYILKKISIDELFFLVKAQIEMLNYSDHDIIITGLNHYNHENPFLFNSYNFKYLFDTIMIEATQPDIMIFVMNDFDNLNEIRKRIQSYMHILKKKNIMIIKNTFSEINVNFSEKNIKQAVYQGKTQYQKNFDIIKTNLEKTFETQIIDFSFFSEKKSEFIYSLINKLKI